MSYLDRTCLDCHETEAPSTVTTPLGRAAGVVALGLLGRALAGPLFLHTGWGEGAQLAYAFAPVVVALLVMFVAGRAEVCTRCGSTRIIPAVSTRAKAIIAANKPSS